jgi:hypothetical protein
MAAYDEVPSSWGNGAVSVDADGSALSMEEIATELNRLTTQRNHLLTACQAAHEWLDGPGCDVYGIDDDGAADLHTTLLLAIRMADGEV